MRNRTANLDDLDVNVLQSRVTEKWNTYPEAELNAWVAEMDYPLADPIRRVLQTAVVLVRSIIVQAVFLRHGR